jgi:hypothetical protein
LTAVVAAADPYPRPPNVVHNPRLENTGLPGSARVLRTPVMRDWVDHSLCKE